MGLNGASTPLRDDRQFKGDSSYKYHTRTPIIEEVAHLVRQAARGRLALTPAGLRSAEWNAVYRLKEEKERYDINLPRFADLLRARQQGRRRKPNQQKQK